MPLVSMDYGKDLVTTAADGAFFLDTNFIVACHDERNAFHKASAFFLLYLIKSSIPMIVSEAVIHETVHVLGRMYYMREEFYKLYGTGEELTYRQRREEMNRFRQSWATAGKRNKVLLAKYNEKAVGKLQEFLSLTNVLFESLGYEEVQESLQTSVEVPLYSADALIVTAAKKVGATGLISLDSDMAEVTDLDIFRTVIHNADYEEERMKQLLHIEELVDFFDEIPQPLR